VILEEVDAGDKVELILFRPALAPALGFGVAEARYGTLSSGEGWGCDARGLLDVGGGSGLLLSASSLRMWPFAFCAVSRFPLAS